MMILQRIKYLLSLSLILFSMSGLAETSPKRWQDDVGAKSFPSVENTLCVNDFGANNKGLILSTKAIQEAIDKCAASGGGKVVFEPGTYLSGSIFVKSNVNLCIGQGVEIRGVIDLEQYPEIDTRIAGIEMKWPAALINVTGQKNAAVTGKGSVHAQGRYHWERYWQLRNEYTPKGLRWASDYDCKRVRTILVSESEHISVKDLTLKQAGFWTVHILYSDQVTVDGVIVLNNVDGHGPSTDGIDIDSSSDVLVQNCDIDCNDDNFCLKAGRDADGLRVNRPCERVVIRDCISRKGGGLITLGSETSGGIRQVEVYNLKADGTHCAIRMKSALTRGGTVEDIYIHDIKMDNVLSPIEVSLNWNPSYSYASVENANTDIPHHWKVMLEKVSPEEGMPHFRNITISNIEAINCRSSLTVSGIEESYLENFTLKNIDISCDVAGKMAFTKGWRFRNVNIVSKDGKSLMLEKNVDFKHRKAQF